MLSATPCAKVNFGNIIPTAINMIALTHVAISRKFLFVYTIDALDSIYIVLFLSSLHGKYSSVIIKMP